jgi:hypothetical protein
MLPNLGKKVVLSDSKIFDELIKNKKDALWLWDNAQLHRVFVFNGLHGRFQHSAESDEEKATGLMADVVADILADANSKIFFDIVPTACGVDIAKIDEEFEISDDRLKQVLAEIYTELPDEDEITVLMSKYRSEIISLGIYTVLSRAPRVGKMTKSIQSECKKLSQLLLIYIFGDSAEK